MAPDNPAVVPGALAKPDAAARRARLRQYQMQLLERMQAAKSTGQTSVNQLGVMLGESYGLLELTQAGEIVPVGPITPVPLTRDWYLGLTNIRGNLLGVIDIARYQGLPAATIGPDSRIITFASGLGFNCGALVSKVLGLRNVAEMAPQEEGAGDGVHYRDRELHSWRRIDLAQLVRDTRFLHIGF